MPEVYELDPSTCERLLSRGSFGRFAMATPRGPEIVPVNYVVRDGAVVVRTDPAGVLACHASSAPLVFEVDAVDPEYWTGFSVIARGVGEVGPAPEAGSGIPSARPWAEGDRTCEVRMAWTELTGRRVGRDRGLESAQPFGRAL